MDLKKYLEEKKIVVEQYLDRALGSDYIENPKLLEAMRHVTLAGGKRLRPIYVGLVADCIREGSGPDTLPVGCAMEVAHNFTLVHDDIMDNSDKRHGVRAVHVEYDLNTAINAGDTLFARAFEMICEGPYEAEVKARLVAEMSRMIIKIAEGQQSDLDFENMEVKDVGEGDYIQMVENKTARMFQYGARFAGIINGLDEARIDRLGEMGRLAGIGFQIADDILDLTAPPEILKKPRGGDIREGKKTLIVLKASKLMPSSEWSRFLKYLGKGDATEAEIEEAIGMLESCGAIDATKVVADDYISRAYAILEDELEESESRAMLKALIRYLVTREF